jgi:hypothetical protein
LEEAIADRTVEYEELGKKIRLATAAVLVGEQQTAWLSREIEKILKRTKTAWWWSLLSFLVGVAFSDLVEWTAGPLKPPSIP